MEVGNFGEQFDHLGQKMRVVFQQRFLWRSVCLVFERLFFILFVVKATKRVEKRIIESILIFEQIN